MATCLSSFRWFEGFNWEGLRQGSIDPPYTPTVSIPRRPVGPHASDRSHPLSSVRWRDRWTTATLTTSPWTQTPLLTKNPVGTLSFSRRDCGKKLDKRKKQNKTYEQDFRLKLGKRDFMCDFCFGRRRLCEALKEWLRLLMVKFEHEH